MERILKKNRKQILGKEFFLSDENSLTAKFNYENGIAYFDDILQGKSQKEFKAAMHLYARNNGVEIKLAKLLNGFSIGFTYNEIQKIVFFNIECPYIEIILQDEKIKLSFKKEDVREVMDFFYKHLYSFIEINSTELSKFKTRYSFLKEYKKKFYCARIGRLDYFLWVLSLGFIGNIIVFSNEDIWTTIIISLITLILKFYAASLRFRDLNKKPVNAFQLLIPVYNIYIQIILLFKKGDEGRNEYGVNPSFSQEYF
jgi:uncharacterized membrane protein YhaH (DUF805 family)